LKKATILFVSLTLTWGCLAVNDITRVPGTSKQIERAKKTIIKRRNYENIEVISLERRWKSRYYSNLEQTVKTYSIGNSKTIQSKGSYTWEFKFYSTRNKYEKLNGTQRLILTNNLKTILYYE